MLLNITKHYQVNQSLVWLEWAVTITMCCLVYNIITYVVCSVIGHVCLNSMGNFIQTSRFLNVVKLDIMV